MPMTKLTDKKKEKFLNTLAEGWSVTRAAKKAAVSRGYMYEVRNQDPDFAKAWDDAIEEGTDRLEDIANARGMRRSDTMLIVTLKARRPEKYKDRYESTVKGRIDNNINVSLSATDALLTGVAESGKDGPPQKLITH